MGGLKTNVADQSYYRVVLIAELYCISWKLHWFALFK